MGWGVVTSMILESPLAIVVVMKSKAYIYMQFHDISCICLLSKKSCRLGFQHDNHSKGIFNLNKRLPNRGWTKIHTGNIDGFWKGLKKTVPDSLPSKNNGKRNVNLWKCLRRYQWRWECTGKKLMKHTDATLKTL